MTVARRTLLAAQLLALGGPALVLTYLVFDVTLNSASFFGTVAIGFAVAAVQGVAGIVWSGVLIHNHVELRSGSNYKLQLMAALVTGMLALTFFTFQLPELVRR
jgi:hypothetical protein